MPSSDSTRKSRKTPIAPMRSSTGSGPSFNLQVRRTWFPPTSASKSLSSRRTRSPTAKTGEWSRFVSLARQWTAISIRTSTSSPTSGSIPRSRAASASTSSFLSMDFRLSSASSRHRYAIQLPGSTEPVTSLNMRRASHKCSSVARSTSPARGSATGTGQLICLPRCGDPGTRETGRVRAHLPTLSEA